MYRAFVQHKPLRRTFRLLVLLILVSLGVVHTAMAVPSYRLQLLLTLGGPFTSPVSINNTEEIAGYAFAANEPYVDFMLLASTALHRLDTQEPMHLQSTLAEWSSATTMCGHSHGITAAIQTSGLGTRLA